MKKEKIKSDDDFFGLFPDRKVTRGQQIANDIIVIIVCYAFAFSMFVSAYHQLTVSKNYVLVATVTAGALLGIAAGTDRVRKIRKR